MAPHLTPVDDPAGEFRAQIAADRRRTRNKVLAALGLVVLLAVAALVATSYFDAERVIAAERPRTDPIKAQYCKILDAENARPEQSAPPGTSAVAPTKVTVPDAIRLLGFFAPDYDNISRENPRGNADAIELGEIAWLCGDRSGHFAPDLLFSNFTKLYDGDAVKRYQRKGAQRLATAVTRLAYVVVARKKKFVRSAVNGENTLQPGHYTAQVMLYRLADAALMAEVTVDEDAPGIAALYLHQNRFGSGSPDEISAGLDGSTRLAFEATVQRLFKERGVDLALGYEDK